MEDTHSVASLIDSTSSKIQQLQKAFAELESQRAVTLNLKWKELEDHFHGLERSLKRRFHELEDQEKEYETKTRKAQELLKKREAAVTAKETTSLERLQRKRDAAIFAINSALEKHKNGPSADPVIKTDGQNGKVSVEESESHLLDADGAVEDVQNSTEYEYFEVKSYPQLLNLCQNMDAAGLQKFVSDNRKNLAALKDEIPYALKAAENPASLVLDSLENFYPVETSCVDGKKDSNLLGTRRTCILLMECLSVLLTGLGAVSLPSVLSEDVKLRAKGIAKGWRPRLETLDMDASNGNSLEAHAFLQLLATFGIASGFKEEELSKLIPMVSRRKQAAELCRCLGLSEKMPGVIEVLLNTGRQIDAVNLAFAFELTHRFSPVSLLKAYLTEAKRTSSQCKPGNTAAQDEFNERELAALKAVIKCIEEHNLEDQYSVEPLQKRVIQLEKTKADKKRANEPAKPQPKRPRANVAQPRVPSAVADNKTLNYTNRYPQYVYERPFVSTPIMAPSAPTYTFTPSHGNFYGNCYQYQPSPYFH